jgi:hypothetical protein
MATTLGHRAGRAPRLGDDELMAAAPLGNRRSIQTVPGQRVEGSGGAGRAGGARGRRSRSTSRVRAPAPAADWSEEADGAVDG